MDAEFEKFMVSFSVLEKEMASLSALIEKNAADTTAASQATAAGAEQIILVVLLISTGCMAFFALVVIRAISGNIRRVLEAVDQLNSGDSNLNHRIPQLQGEFAALGNSLNEFIANLGRIVTWVFRTIVTSDSGRS